MNTVQPVRDLRLLDAFKQELSQNPRNHLLVTLALNSGLRIGDCLKLTVGHVRNKSHVVLREQKTGKEKRFKINPILESYLKAYIPGKDDTEYLFRSRQGGNKPITRYMGYKIISEAAKKVGLKEVGTHSLRKTLGYFMYQKTKDIALVMTFLNHSSPRVTMKYLGILSDDCDSIIDQMNL